MMYKYTILYKNGKTWSGKAAHYTDIPLVDCLVMVCITHIGDGYNEQSFWVPTGVGLDNEWYLLNELYVPISKQRTPNPNSKTKKQKKFDEDYREWKEANENSIIWTDTSVKAYKKHLWNCKQLITDVREWVAPYYEQWLKDQADKLVEDDGWIPWNGGSCPVAVDTKVAVKFGCGLISSRVLAGTWDWRHGGLSFSYNIVAYKLLDKRNPIKTTYTFWLGAGGEVVDEQ